MYYISFLEDFFVFDTFRKVPCCEKIVDAEAILLLFSIGLSIWLPGLRDSIILLSNKALNHRSNGNLRCLPSSLKFEYSSKNVFR